MNEEIYNALKAIDRITKEPIKEGHLGDMANRVELDHEVQLARGQLYKIAKYAIKMHEMLRDVSEVQGLEGWVSAKITKAATYMDDVGHYIEYDMSPANITNEGMEVTRGMAADLLHKVDEDHPLTQVERMRQDMYDKRGLGPDPRDYEKNPLTQVERMRQDMYDKRGLGGDSRHPKPEDYDPGFERDRTGPPEEIAPETDAEIDDKMNADPYGADFTRGLDPEFSKRVADQNKKNMDSVHEVHDHGFMHDEMIEKGPYILPINPDTGEPWTDEERGPMRRIPKPGGIGYYTGDNAGIYTGTMEYVPGRDDPPGGFKPMPLQYRPHVSDFKNWGRN